jgi:chorismate mutase/prephenate dehydratase
MDIGEIRKKIDKVDDKILELLNKRAKLILQLAKEKEKRNIPYYVPIREKKIFERILKNNKGPLPQTAVKSIFREIISSSLSLEKELKVAYLGPPASFTHIAVLEKFGSQIKCVSESSIKDVFLVVEKKEADYGVVPIENSTEGVINHTLDMFLNSNLSICAEIYINVSHNFLSRGELKDIKRVYSNPQAFAQCKIWLRNNLKTDLEFIEVSSTTYAAELAQKDKNSAAIASKLAAERYGLKILFENIQDNPDNKTRFLVIGDSKNERSGKDKTSLMFSVKNKPGALFSALAPLSKHRVNMTMIESRPAGHKIWEYVFFVDIQGYVEDEPVKKALSEMEKHCLFLKILGSYPEEVG